MAQCQHQQPPMQCFLPKLIQAGSPNQLRLVSLAQSKRLQKLTGLGRIFQPGRHFSCPFCCLWEYGVCCPDCLDRSNHSTFCHWHQPCYQKVCCYSYIVESKKKKILTLIWIIDQQVLAPLKPHKAQHAPAREIKHHKADQQDNYLDLTPIHCPFGRCAVGLLQDRQGTQNVNESLQDGAFQQEDGEAQGRKKNRLIF